MFTGVIRHTGIVTDMKKKKALLELKIHSPLFQKMKNGDSVAVDGVCLTVTRLKKDTAFFDVVPETQQKTTLKNLQKKQKVHVESPLKYGDAIHGHILLGHIDTTAKIIENKNGILTIGLPPLFQKKVVQKGSIGINGVSLTVASIGTQSCTVALIPETIKRTTLGAKKTGDMVNIEIDLTERYKPVKIQKTNARIAIVAARFNQFIVEKLVTGAMQGLTEKGVKNVPVFWVPGAFEIPLTAKKLALTKKYDAIITLGTVIKGDTEHYTYVCAETARGIAQAGLETGIPIIFEVLMCDTVEKALARATGDIQKNKGYHAAAAALHMINTFKNI